MASGLGRVLLYGGRVRGPVVWVLFVSGFLAAPSTHVGSFFGKGGVWGVWYGVVV